MPIQYVCRKCNRNYVQQYYIRNKFCEICGSFLIENRNIEEVIIKEKEEAPIIFKGQGSINLSREQTKEQTGKELTKIYEEDGNKRIITYSDPSNIRRLLQNNQFFALNKFLLNLKAREIKSIGSIDKLLSIDFLRTKLDPYPFQMKVALNVLRDMNSNAILADEVGLGKTIEAGLVLKELIVRGLVNSVLVVVPKSLMKQWQGELSSKFGEQFVKTNDRDFAGFNYENKVICSSGILVRRFKEIQKKHWDLVVVDEAHVFRNLKSKGRDSIAHLDRTYLLLLSATPLCNKLTDLYSLVDLINPGMLDSERTFISRYAADNKCRVIQSDMVDSLRSTLNKVMCRTRRMDTDFPFTQRFVESRSVNAGKIENQFIEQSTEYLKDIGNNKFKTIEQLRAENPVRAKTEAMSKSLLIFQAISMQQSLSSSPFAAIESLNNRNLRHPSESEAIKKLIKLAEQITIPSKFELLKDVLKEVEKEQAIIFCARKITAQKIKQMLDKDFGRSEVFQGDMGASAREKVLDEFKSNKIKYLVATDAAAEGLNLQNCCIMFNYDLHWNPMKIEQRIGRIHRLGQDRDVTVFNLSVKDTIDDYVLHILYQKIELFTMTVGKMETVLAEIQEGSQDLEKIIMEIIFRSKTHHDIKKELEKLSTTLKFAKEKQELSEQFTKGVLN